MKLMIQICLNALWSSIISIVCLLWQNQIVKSNLQIVISRLLCAAIKELHRTSIGGPGGGHGGARAPPKFYWLHFGEARAPQNFYRIHNDLESLFEKNKQIGKVQTISSKFVQNFLKNSQNFQKSLIFRIIFAKFS